MTAPAIRRLALLAALAPLALGLSACQKGTDAGNAAAPGAALARIAPPAGKAWTDMVSETADGGMVLGNPDAPIKLIEYGSLSCPHCAKLAQEGFARLSSDYIASGRVSLEFRSFAIHPQDVPLTLLVRCGPKETFFPLVEQVYANFDAMNAPMADKAVQQKANAAMQFPPEQRMAALADALEYTRFFAGRGIATAQAHSCLADGGAARRIAELSQKYSDSGINGTPALFVNGTKVETTEWAELEAALQRAGAR